MIRSFALCCVLLACACGRATQTSSASPDASTAADAGAETSPDASAATATVADCDPLQARCGLPFPSSFYLQPDASTATGYRLQFGAHTLPKNAAGQHLDPAPYAQLDGFGVGSSVLVQFPHVDASGMASQAHIELSLAPSSTSVWLELDAKGQVVRKIPHWAELDARPNDAKGTGIDPATQLLFLRPAVILDYGHRYVVAFRQLKTTAGQPVARSPAFQQLLDGTYPDPARQARFGQILAALQSQGIAASELTLAWDFVTYSSAAIHGRMLEMRAQAMAAAGTDGPEITLDPAMPDNCGDDPHIAVSLRGHFRTPDFLAPQTTADGTTLWRWHTDAQGKLAQTGWRQSEFWLRVPKSCLGGQVACDVVQYGHGLLGTGHEVCNGWAARNADERHLIYVGSNMIGMAEEDNLAVLHMLTDMNLWPALPERVTAGVIEHVLIQRALRQRLPKLGWLVEHGVQLSGQVYWSGNSQGGIYGQTVLALSEDVTRAHLGQAGVSYAMLVERSKDFDDFSLLLGGQYPDRIDYALVLSTIQLLWDRVDPVSHVRHIGEPLPGLPPHAALVVVHPGDFQVDPVTDEVVARSGYVHLLAGYGRAVPLVAASAYPLVGSGLVSIDFGNTWNDHGNLPGGPQPGLDCGGAGLVADGIDDGTCLGAGICDPKGSFEPCVLGDPHDRAHGLKAHNDQMLHFFHTGEIIDTCGGDGCRPQ